MKSTFRTWLYITIAVEFLSTALAWVVNGDVISSIIVSALPQISLGISALVSIGTFSFTRAGKKIVRAEAIALLGISLLAIIFAAFTAGAAGGIRTPVAIEFLDFAGMFAALILLTWSYELLRLKAIPWPAAAFGLLAAIGEVAADIDSIDLIIIAVSRALLILFLFLLAHDREM
ncbi:MAG TPA: hypothetical protein VG537_01660 [Candidatus Kapabacteria bacterium]|nr:hypothetical protein [Candidatus Kapabacteria bacterium]